jgi:hypothetical protein
MVKYNSSNILAMKLTKLLLISLLLSFFWAIGCGEKRVIIIHASDSSKKLIQILMKPDPDSKSRNHLYAAKYLGKRRERSAVPVLIQTTIHSNERIVRQALTALGLIGQEHPDLRQKIAKAINPFLLQSQTRDTAERALHSWEEKKNPSKRQRSENH